jgi:probable phosphoglycerate mutase
MSQPAPLRLHLIRHGETVWSLSGQHTGSTDIPLTEHGEDEARALVPWLGGRSFTRVLCSPRQRARRTCDLAGVTAPADGSVETTPDLAEWDYGDYEGRRSAEIKQTRPGWNIFADGCPGGESPAEVAARADRLIGTLQGLQGNVALFSHGHFSSVLATRWIGQPVIMGEHLSLSTASLSILGYAPSHPDVRVLALWNATPTALGATAP